MPSHLEEFLVHYLQLKDPGYAVLVTGAWGSGKTFQVRKCVPKEHRYYVSLYGVQTVEQLHAEVFATASPKLAVAAEAAEKVGDVAASAGGVIGLASATPSVFNAIFRRDVKPDRTLIFDDLERSELRLKDVLGAINSYVEQKGFRVIVIAHDEKMAKKFRELKEKTFGQTIRIEPQVEDALKSFLVKIRNARAMEFITSHQSAILGIFKSSGVGSLRILRHVTEDLERLVKTLSDKHLGHAQAMGELVPLFAALNIDTRASRIVGADLGNRRDVRSRYQMSLRQNRDDPPEMPGLLAADDRYPTVDIQSNLLSDDVLYSMFVEGRYPADEIRHSLNNSGYFLEAKAAAPWKVLIQFDQLDDSIVSGALEGMEQQIKQRSATESGEILHIFALKLMMVENDIQSETMDDVVAEAISYIDDLRTAGSLPPRSTDWRWSEPFRQSFDGYGYWVTEATKLYFRKIHDHLISAREKVFEDQFPKIVAELLEMVRSDSIQFFEQVSPTNNGENPYELIPLLHHIPAQEFVDAWLDSPYDNWRNISHAIDNRYSPGRLRSELAVEKTWALKVHDLIHQRANEASGWRALRIERVIPNVLLELANERSSEIAEGGSQPTRK